MTLNTVTFLIAGTLLGGRTSLKLNTGTFLCEPIFFNPQYQYMIMGTYDPKTKCRYVSMGTYDPKTKYRYVSMGTYDPKTKHRYVSNYWCVSMGTYNPKTKYQ